MKKHKNSKKLPKIIKNKLPRVLIEIKKWVTPVIVINVAKKLFQKLLKMSFDKKRNDSK